MLTKTALVSAGILSFVSVVSAADIAVPAPIEPVSVAPDWTGFHIGVHGGGAWGDYETELTSPLLPGFTLGLDENAGGFVVGGQAGFNKQFDQFVLGVEADIAYAAIEGDTSLSLTIPGPTTLGVSAEFSTEYLATFRGRVGYAFDNILVYATGGAAVTEVEVEFSALGASISDSDTLWGWTIGGGVEVAINEGWSVKAEYLYIDFDSENFFEDDLGGFADYEVDLDAHIVKAGVNYRF